MLADPRHSRIVLINPARSESAKTSVEFAARRRASISLVSDAFRIFGVSTLAVGDHDLTLGTETMADAVTRLDIDGLSLWRRNRAVLESLSASDVGVVFLGGVWLEEEIFIAALEGARLGYDVRLLVDVSVARLEGDSALVLNRMALHGVLSTTVRQALLEWAACLDDAVLTATVQGLLS